MEVDVAIDYIAKPLCDDTLPSRYHLPFKAPSIIM
jgi:hypothetical protein